VSLPSRLLWNEPEKNLVYVYLVIAKRPLFAKIITKNGKKKLKMIDL